MLKGKKSSYLSEDQAFLASLALPRSQLAGAVFAGHHLWWKGKDTAAEDQKVKLAKKEGNPKKTILVQYGASTSLKGLTQGLDAEMAWNSGHDLKKGQAYFKIKKIGTNSNVKAKEYYKDIFSEVIPDIRKTAGQSFETAEMLVQEYIPTNEEIEDLIKRMTPDKMGISPAEKKSNLLVDEYNASFDLDQEKLRTLVEKVTNFSNEATATSNTVSQMLKKSSSSSDPLPEKVVKNSQKALKKYKDAITELEKEIKKLKTSHARALATFIDKLKKAKDSLATQVKNVDKATRKWKELSARFNEYRLDTIKKKKAAIEKVRKKEEEARATAKKHSDTLALLVDCQERLGSFEKKRTGMTELLEAMETEKKTEKEELEIQKEELEEQIEELRAGIKEDSTAGGDKLNKQKERLEGIIQKLKLAAKTNQVKNKQLTTENKQLIKVGTAATNLIKKLQEEVNQEHKKNKADVVITNEEAEDDVATDEVINEAQEELKEEIENLETIIVDIEPDDDESEALPFKGISNKWIVPTTKKAAIESVFNLNQPLLTNTVDMKTFYRENTNELDPNKFTLWSLILDKEGENGKGFGKKDPSERNYVGQPLTTPFPSELGLSPKNPEDRKPRDYTTPGIFYSLEGPVRLHILLPSRFIRPKKTKKFKKGVPWPGGFTGPHVLIGFSVYLQITLENKKTIRFFTNVESKTEIVTSKLDPQKFDPSYLFLQIGEDGLSTNTKGELAGVDMAYSNKEEDILDVIQSPKKWIGVKAHVTRVYIHRKTGTMNGWKTERGDEWADGNPYGKIETNLQKWLIANERDISFVTDTNLTGIEIKNEIAIETEFPSDSGKWLRQTSFTATPEFW